MRAVNKKTGIGSSDLKLIRIGLISASLIHLYKYTKTTSHAA